MRKWVFILCLCLLTFLFITDIYAIRVSRPPKLSKKLAPNEISQLNDYLESIWNLQNGEFNFDIVTSSKTNADNGDLWIKTPQLAEIQYKAGDIIYTLSPIVYGEIFADDAGVTIALGGDGGEDDKAQITAFNENGVFYNTVVSHASDDITITIAGNYLCVVSLHVESTAGGGDTFGYKVYKNNGVTSVPGLHAHRDMAGGGGDVGSVSISGLATFAVGDTIEVWVWNEDDASDIVIDDINLSVVRLGP